MSGLEGNRKLIPSDIQWIHIPLVSYLPAYIIQHHTSYMNIIHLHFYSLPLSFNCKKLIKVEFAPLFSIVFLGELSIVDTNKSLKYWKQPCFKLQHIFQRFANIPWVNFLLQLCLSLHPEWNNKMYVYLLNSH